MIQRELRLIRYAVFSWRSPDALADNENTFTCYRESGWPQFLIGILFLIAFESLAVRLFLSHWGAWVLRIHLGLAIYGALWLIGDYQAIKKSLIELTPTSLHVRIGERQNFTVPLRMISDALLGEPAELDQSAEVRMNQPIRERKIPGYKPITVMGRPSVHLTLKKPLQLPSPLGRIHAYDRIGLGIDAPRAFVSRVRVLTHDNEQAPA